MNRIKWMNIIIVLFFLIAFLGVKLNYFIVDDVILALDNNVKAEKIILNKKVLNMQVGSREMLSATVVPSNASGDVMWASTNKNVVNVTDSGEVTAIASGSAIIVAISKSNNSVKDICKITVSNASSSSQTVNVTSLVLSKKSLTVMKGKSGRISVNVLPNDATNKAVNWSSSDPNVVVVSNDGIISAVGVGTATIKVTSSSNPNVSDSCQIKVVGNNVSSSSVVGNGASNISSYTIRLNANGGSGSAQSIVCAYGRDCTLSAKNFVKKGYSISGWATSATGEKKYSNGSKVKNLAKSGVVDLYAVWKINTVKIKYNVNGGNFVANEVVVNKKTYNWTKTKDGIIYKNGRIFSTKINYDGKLKKAGLTDYDGNTLKIKKNGFFVEKDKEWCTKPDGNGTCYSQKSVYDATKFCGSIEKNSCEVTLYLKWNNFSNAVDNCNNGKSVFSNKKKKVTLRQCVYDYESGSFQNVGITDDYLYISKSHVTTDKNNKPIAPDPPADAVNIVHKINKKTGELVAITFRNAGHGQSFDVTSDNQLVLNYFAKTNEATNGNRGFGIVSVGLIRKNDEIIPDSAYAVTTDSKEITGIDAYTSSKTIKELAKNKTIAKDNKYLNSAQIAVDKASDKILIYDYNSHNAYIYKLSDLKKKIKNKIKVIKINKKGFDYGQGVAIKGNYIYLLGDNNVNFANKIYKSKSHFVYKCNISKGSCTTYNFKNTVVSQESEGISIYKNKVYVAMKTTKKDKNEKATYKERDLFNLYYLQGV